VGHRQRPSPNGRPVDVPLVEHWDGIRWKVTAGVAAGVKGRLDSISCVASRTCTAMGSMDDGTQVVTQSPGAGWTAHSLPAPIPTAVHLRIDALSCADSGTCTAIGLARYTGGSGGPFIARRSAGGPWTAADSAVGVGPSVSCGDASHCIVTATSVGNTGQAFRSSGLTVTPLPFVNPEGNPGGQLHTVSCLPSGFCAAGGQSAGGHVFAVRESGTWSTTPGDDQQSHVGDLSCVSTTFCLAVGQGRFPDRQPVSYAWNGTRWSDVPVTTAPTGSDVELSRISCVSTDWCLALGSADGAPFLLRWNGATWKPSSALSLPAHTHLGSVSCTSTSWCVVVGSSGARPAHKNPLIATFDGKRWSQAPGVSTRLPSISLSSVSCTSRRFCMVVGQAGKQVRAGTKPHVKAVAVAERWNGHRWRRAPGAGTLPTWDTMGVQLHSVSCSGPQACMDTDRTWAGVWDGQHWAQSQPPASLRRDASMRDVSCLANLFCLGVGFIVRHAYHQQTLTPVVVTSSP
jgi:hypothetical protein